MSECESGPQRPTTALLYLARVQAVTLTKVLRLRPVGRRAILHLRPLEAADVVSYALFVVHTDIIGTGGERLGSPLCHLGNWFFLFSYQRKCGRGSKLNRRYMR